MILGSSMHLLGFLIPLSHLSETQGPNILPPSTAGKLTLREDKDLSKGLVPVMSAIHHIYLVELRGTWQDHPSFGITCGLYLLQPIKWVCCLLSHGPGKRGHFRCWRFSTVLVLGGGHHGSRACLPPASREHAAQMGDGPCRKPQSLGDICYCSVTEPFLNQTLRKRVSWQGQNLNLVSLALKLLLFFPFPSFGTKLMHIISQDGFLAVQAKIEINGLCTFHYLLEGSMLTFHARE